MAFARAVMQRSQAGIARGTGKVFEGGTGTRERTQPAVHDLERQRLQQRRQHHPAAARSVLVGWTLCLHLRTGRYQRFTLRKTHFFAIPLLAAPAIALGIDDAGPGPATAFVVRHAQLLEAGPARSYRRTMAQATCHCSGQGFSEPPSFGTDGPGQQAQKQNAPFRRVLKGQLAE